MIGTSEFRINCIAEPANVRPLRHALGAFLDAHSIESDDSDDILTAVGEVLANAVEHAYVPGSARDLELFVRFEPDETLTVDVFDRGQFIERPERPGRSFGLRIVRAIARTFEVETGNGTRVHMLFGAARDKAQAS